MSEGAADCQSPCSASQANDDLSQTDQQRQEAEACLRLKNGVIFAAFVYDFGSLQEKLALNQCQIASLRESLGVAKKNPYSGRFPPIVIKVADEMPGISVHDIYAIFQNKFQAADLHRLRYDNVDEGKDVRDTIEASADGDIQRGHRIADPKQFDANVRDIVQCLLNFRRIYRRLFDGNLDMTTSVAIGCFVVSLINKAVTWHWDEFNKHTLLLFERGLENMHDPKSWDVDCRR